MAHGQHKAPRHKSLNDALYTRRSGAHEPKQGKNAKRAKVARQNDRELREEGY